MLASDEQATQFFAYFLIDVSAMDPLPRTGQMFWTRAAAREYVKTHGLPPTTRVRRAKVTIYRS